MTIVNTPSEEPNAATCTFSSSVNLITIVWSPMKYVANEKYLVM